MKSSKQLLSLILALLMAAPAIVSCSEQTAVEETQPDQVPSAENVVSAVETEKEVTDIDLLAEADFEGYTFNILSTDPECLWGYMVSIYAEEETGEPLNDAVFRRNTAIEDRYNITITNTADADSSPTSGKAKSSITAGEDTYSIVSYGVKWQLVDAMGGYFINLHNVEAIDFANPWWNGHAADLLTIQEKLYMAFGEMNVFDNEAIGALYVNNDIVTNHNLESPYDLVREGAWTFDVMYEMAETVTQDLDGDGTASENDVLGFVGGIGSFNVMLTSADQPHILIGEDGKYILNHGTEESIDAAGKIARIVNDTSVSGYLNDQSWSGGMFPNGKALFYHEGLSSLSKLRDKEFALGLVPMPKRNEEQEKYRSMYSNQSMTIAIPKSSSDPERAGFISDALSAYSRLPLREVYYESMLKSKAARDEETSEMLDIIIENKCVDVGVLNEISWGTVISSYFNAIRKSGTDNLASTAASNVGRFEKALAKVEDKYSGLE